MSWLPQGVVWKSGCPGSTKLLLLALADQANDDGLTVYGNTSQAALAERCTMSKRQIQRKIHELSAGEAPLLTVIPRPPGSHQHDHYQLHLDRIAAVQPPGVTKCHLPPKPGVKTSPGRATPDVAPRGDKMSPPSKEPSTQKEKSAPPARPSSTGEQREAKKIAPSLLEQATAAQERKARRLFDECTALGIDVAAGMSVTVYEALLARHPVSTDPPVSQETPRGSVA